LAPAAVPRFAISPDEAAQVTSQALARARARWPGVAHDEARFAADVAARLAAATLPLEALARLHVEDMWLAGACACGSDEALRAIDAEHIGQVAAWVRHIDASPSFASEIRQAVRMRLFSSKDDEPLVIGRYDGSVPLAGWLRVIAIRLALNARRGKRPAVASPTEVGMLPDSALDPERVAIKRRYKDAFNAALAASLLALPPRDATLLRLHHAEGVSLDALAQMYGAHRATIARWLAAARARVLDAVRARLADELSISPSDVESLVGDLQSQVDISLIALLP
jgi:RNA polymerase sigma-70 factor (ECF subfamily)